MVEPGEGEPGCLIDEGLCVATQEGGLRFRSAARKKRMEAAAFLRGCPLAIGDRLDKKTALGRERFVYKRVEK